MPEITPITPEGTITIQANTQMPSAKMGGTPASESVAAPPPTQEPQKTIGSEIEDQKILKQRLATEKIKRQLDAERKSIANEKRMLDLERSSSKKWLEAEDLVRQGKYVEAAQRAGLSYDQLTQQILNNGNIPPAQVAEQTASSLVEKKFQEFQKQQEALARQAQQRQYNESIKHMSAEVKHIVDTSDKYPLVKNAESYQDIVRFIESEFHRTGRIVPLEEAIQRWEDDALEGLLELNKLEKVRSSIYRDPQRTPNQEQRVPNTLSQKTMGSVPAPKSLTEQERKQRAIDAFYGRIT